MVSHHFGLGLFIFKSTLRAYPLFCFEERIPPWLCSSTNRKFHLEIYLSFLHDLAHVDAVAI